MPRQAQRISAFCVSISSSRRFDVYFFFFLLLLVVESVVEKIIIRNNVRTIIECSESLNFIL